MISFMTVIFEIPYFDVIGNLSIKKYYEIIK